MNNTLRFILESSSKTSLKMKGLIHSNIYMVIGCYGTFAIILVCLASRWFFHAPLAVSVEHLLPPAWQNNGDINHILGTDKEGKDIFNYLLMSYKWTLILSVRAIFYVIIIGALINYLLFLIPLLRSIFSIIFRFIIAIPPILTAIVVSLLWNDNINSMLLVISLSYMPRFVQNIQTNVMQEWQKTYIIAHRLDGIPSIKILIYYILPNILPAYLTEVVALFSNVILTLTIFTFLGFSHNLHTPDLGIMMHQMLTIFDTNHWAFLSSGVAIIITILVINSLNLGINMILVKRVGN